MIVMVMAMAEVMAMIVVMVAIQEQLHSLKTMITEEKRGLLSGREIERAWASVRSLAKWMVFISDFLLFRSVLFRPVYECNSK